MENNVFQYREQDVQTRQNAFITNVYGLMTGALAITGFIAWYVSNDEGLVRSLSGSFTPLLLCELAVVWGLSWLINRISVNVARLLFVLYSALNGLTFGVIFSLFTGASIASTFFITAGTFGVMSIYGYITKTDLTKLGQIMIMALVGIIIASVVNIFMHSEEIYWITTYIGVVVFVGLIAYDTQKLKNMAVPVSGQNAMVQQKASIMGALALYLDFINLFLMLLRILGRRR